MIKEHFTKENYFKVLGLIANDKSAEVDFERHFKDNEDIACMKHFSKGFFELYDNEQEALMAVLSFVAKNAPNSSAKVEDLNSSKGFFRVLAEAKLSKNDREKLEEKFNRLSSCRDSSEVTAYIKKHLLRFIDKPFDGYALAEDIAFIDFNSYNVYRKWIRDDYCSFKQDNGEDANV